MFFREDNVLEEDFFANEKTKCVIRPIRDHAVWNFVGNVLVLYIVGKRLFIVSPS